MQSDQASVCVSNLIFSNYCASVLQSLHNEVLASFVGGSLWNAVVRCVSRREKMRYMLHGAKPQHETLARTVGARSSANDGCCLGCVSKWSRERIRKSGEK